eukprot:CAMPEP_0178727148 /NCGR_PEP_ID=MMETSP0699-20121125/27706_1 /TAXON_ID=265572 /ORGANISM="Extubocellulus spinifer, Strain CCMP396" /LENGTH=260 /DNA_ID=CAMNT_0020378837 /DNA_START=12 /DNA_END=794 /DNA_ORIENTATION=-
MSARIHIVNDQAQKVAAAHGVSAKPSLTVDAALNSLLSEGLKKTTKLSATNMNVFHGLENTIFPKDFAVNVTVQLQRDKDLELPHRLKLANEVRDTVAEELQSVFRGGQPGEKDDADATLVVRILLVSDGSSKGSRWLGGVGSAKLTLAWFLVSNCSSGEVATGKQIYLTEDSSPAASSGLDHWEISSAIVRSMARNASTQIVEEVASEIVSWKQQQGEGSMKEVHQEPAVTKEKEHEEHDVGEDKFSLLQRVMKGLTQV